MNFDDYKLIFVTVGLIGLLLIATPAIGKVIRFPNREQYSELYLLGPTHAIENYPSNIVIGQENSVYVGVTNHIGLSTYYILYIKLKNQTETSPNAVTGAYSSLSPLFEYRFLSQNDATWESKLTFSISNAFFYENQSLIESVIINNISFNVNKSAMWDENTTRFTYQFLFELWIYNTQTNSIEYTNRYVGLQLNLTRDT
jgi:hypothetical protein